MAARRRRQAKLESVSVSVAMLIILAAGIFGLLGTAQTSAYQGYRHYLLGLAKAAATMVDPALHNSIRRPEQLNDADYVRAVEPLRRLRLAVPDIHYVYTFTLDGNDVRFVLDAADPDAKSEAGGSDQSGVWEIYQHRSPAMMLALGTDHRPGVATATTEQVTDEWGTFMTGFAPILDASGHQIGAVGVDVDATLFLARVQAARHRALLGLIPAGALIALLGWVFYRIRLRSLADVAAREAMEAALIKAAQQDKLTELPNREAFMERLGQTLARVRTGKQLQFAVLFLDFDRSFLQDLSTSREVLAVIHATVNLIGNLEMASLAEGVEEASQVAVLRSLGCRYAQGFFFSRPVTADRLLEAMEGETLPVAGQARVVQR